MAASVVQPVVTATVPVTAIDPPPEGQKVSTTSQTLTLTVYSVSSTIPLQAGVFSQVRTLYVDNSANPQTLIVVHGIANQQTTVPADGGAFIPTTSSSAFYPFSISTSSAPVTSVKINLAFYNWFVPPSEWAPVTSITGSINANVTNAALTVEGAVSAAVTGNVTSEILNSTLQTNVLGQTVNISMKQSRPTLQSAVTSGLSVTATYPGTAQIPANRRRQDTWILNASTTVNMGISFDGTNTCDEIVPQSSLNGVGGWKLDQLDLWKGPIWLKMNTATGSAQWTEFSQFDYSLQTGIGTYSTTPTPPFNTNCLKSLSALAPTAIRGVAPGPNCTFEGWINSAVDNTYLRGIFFLNGNNARNFFAVTLPIGSDVLQFNGANPNGAFTVANGTKNVCDGNWHHIALVSQTGGGTAVFVDGVLDITLSYTLAFTGTNTTVPVSPFVGSSIVFLATLSGLTETLNNAASSPIYVAEWSEWTVPKYLQNFTPPMDEYSGQEAGLYALWHFNSDLVDYGPGILLS